MMIVLIVVGIALILFLAAFFLRSNRWKTIMSASGDSTSELQEKHAYLNNEGFRVRLRTDESQSSPGMANVGVQESGFGRSLTKLQVHEEDVKKAAEALDRFERDRVLRQTPIL
ncbi:hypothetical protein [Paenibacillus nasutitermitis]|uniref:Uncharacterized protein n=1 Tax=Paenibacillus nasutitermitis TaxID=1652958 RepID=A0A916Z4U4_9BACL|nr:hypothetical protein [Paenibacillus nasutitermitis]GGD74538.1 hypothetical protein GCM10010911_35560 [Paenibacillus nasutitermitis]